MHSLQADKNVLLTLSTLAKIKPVCTIVKIDFQDDISLQNGIVQQGNGSTLVFTLDTGERFGLEITNKEEAFRQFKYIEYLLEQGGGKLKLQP